MELWRRVAESVTPINPMRYAMSQNLTTPDADSPDVQRNRPPPKFIKPVRQSHRVAEQVIPSPAPSMVRPLDRHGLDSGWERKLGRGLVSPDFTLDLHGHTLDSAHVRLDHGIGLAIAQDARLVLLVTGRARPSDDHASRGDRRGAIRNKFLDWLTAGPYASRIAAVRPAHPRHGGAGAVYIVLKRLR